MKIHDMTMNDESYLRKRSSEVFPENSPPVHIDGAPGVKINDTMPKGPHIRIPGTVSGKWGIRL